MPRRFWGCVIIILLIPVACLAYDIKGNLAVDGTLAVGTSTPNSALDIRSTDADGPVVYFWEYGGAYGNMGAVSGTPNRVSFGYGSEEDDLVITQTGNIGIGTTSPVSKLDVVGGITFDPASSTDNASPSLTTNSADDFLFDTEYIPSYGFGVNHGSATYAKAFMSGFGGLDFLAGNLRWMVLTSDGNLGIKTSTPSSDLSIEYSSTASTSDAIPSMNISNTNTTGYSIALLDIKAENGGVHGQFFADGDGSIIGSPGVFLRTATESTLALGTNQYVRMVVSSAGNVGIGTTSPGSTLTVNGSLSKTSGSFDIQHPDPIKRALGYRLRHCFVESPTRGDNIYRYKVSTVNSSAVVDLPGYFKFLNENEQVWCSPIKHFGQAYGEVSKEQDKLIITSNIDGEYNILLIATRKDKDAVEFFDQDGVEYQTENSIDRYVESMPKEDRYIEVSKEEAEGKNSSKKDVVKSKYKEEKGKYYRLKNINDFNNI